MISRRGAESRTIDAVRNSRHYLEARQLVGGRDGDAKATGTQLSEWRSDCASVKGMVLWRCQIVSESLGKYVADCWSSLHKKKVRK